MKTKYKGNVENQKIEFWNLESSHLRNPESTDVESGIHRHGIRNPQRGIRNPRLSWITLHGAICPIIRSRPEDLSASDKQNAIVSKMETFPQCAYLYSKSNPSREQIFLFLFLFFVCSFCFILFCLVLFLFLFLSFARFAFWCEKLTVL